MLTDLSGVPPWLFVLFAFLFGGIVGSFVNAAIYRLPRGISLWSRSRSFCPQCEALIVWHDNLPIVSYLWLGGRCRACQKPIPRRYLVVELIVAALFALSAYQYCVLNTPPALGGSGHMPWAISAVQLFLIADLACLAFTDLETWTIPLATTWPCILLGLIAAPIFPELHLSATPWTSSIHWNALLDAFQGLIIGAGLLWVINFVCLVLIGKEGMGGGDAHLLGMLGALLGWKPALATFMLGVFLGSFIGVSALLWERWRQRRLGAKWKPRQPAFELPEEEEELGPPPDWPLLALGGGILVFEIILLAIFNAHLHTPAYGATLISPIWGGLMGCLMLLAYPLKKRMVAAGRWPQGEIREREDGKKEEVLEGNYIPFGPSLALAALAVVFYDPLIRSFAWWWFAERPSAWTLYLARHPLPFHLPLF